MLSLAMALSKPKLLQTLPLLALFLILANKVHSQDQTSFTVDNFQTEAKDLTFQGDANVPSGSIFLRLTKTDDSGNPQPASVGRVIYSPPVQFWEPGRQSHFETTIRFVISPVNRNPAEGIAFFIAPVGTTIPRGSSGGNLGIFGPLGTAPALFAVEFDINVNRQWDPNYSHIGININSRRSVNVTRFENGLRQVVTARINYDAPTRRISVRATVGSQTYEVSYVHDLKLVLPQRVQVGISSATGQQVAVHDILSWYFHSYLLWDGNELEYENENEGANIRQYV